MTAQEALEKYRHLDGCLSDREWMLPDGKSDADKLARMLNAICYDLWQAVKAEVAKEPAPIGIVGHGFSCVKVPHTKSGYMHGSGDDTPYDMDGCSYCGRCHMAI